MNLDGKRVLVTGGTGSLGQHVVRRLLSGGAGAPARVVVLSRDEAKQHDMRLGTLGPAVATDDVIFEQRRSRLGFRIGDVRDLPTMMDAVRESDVVIHAAALKQVPTCEYFPREAVFTNVLGADTLVRAVQAVGAHVEAVVGISTDKACKPVNVMGMTKSLMERIFVAANVAGLPTRFMCVRYGNVIASRGSVFPLFEQQAASGGPVTVTSFDMTRFLLTLEQATDVIFAALEHGRAGEIIVPRAPAARVVDIARAIIGDRAIPVREIGIRPGEKIHEIMVSEEECARTSERAGFYAIAPMLPELREAVPAPAGLEGEYSSAEVTLDASGVRALIDEAPVRI
ncbi:MAG: polysaccharide biosynthesis protein [Vicinamibacterales bacterium]